MGSSTAQRGDLSSTLRIKAGSTAPRPMRCAPFKRSRLVMADPAAGVMFAGNAGSPLAAARTPARFTPRRNSQAAAF